MRSGYLTSKNVNGSASNRFVESKIVSETENTCSHVCNAADNNNNPMTLTKTINGTNFGSHVQSQIMSSNMNLVPQQQNHVNRQNILPALASFQNMVHLPSHSNLLNASAALAAPSNNVNHVNNFVNGLNLPNLVANFRHQQPNPRLISSISSTYNNHHMLPSLYNFQTTNKNVIQNIQNVRKTSENMEVTINHDNQIQNSKFSYQLQNQNKTQNFVNKSKVSEASNPDVVISKKSSTEQEISENSIEELEQNSDIDVDEIEISGNGNLDLAEILKIDLQKNHQENQENPDQKEKNLNHNSVTDSQISTCSTSSPSRSLVLDSLKQKNMSYANQLQNIQSSTQQWKSKVEQLEKILKGQESAQRSAAAVKFLNFQNCVKY